MPGVKVIGISLVRNEADVIGVTIAHHLALGLDGIVVADNGSTDGTDEVLRRISKGESRLRWRRDESPFDQAVLTTRLAREAYDLGADWVVPFDADEFWWAGGKDLKTILARTDASVLSVELVTFVQARRHVRSTTLALADITWRPANQLEPDRDTRDLIEARQLACLEMAALRKLVFRANPKLEVGRGNHKIAGVAGTPEKCDSIKCLHAPLRSREVLEARAEREGRLEDAGIRADTTGGWRTGYWIRTAKEGMMEQEWAANSCEDGYLDVYGKKHRVVFDPRLRNAVAPHLQEVSERFSPVRLAFKDVGNRARSALTSVTSMVFAKRELAGVRRDLSQVRRELDRTKRRLKRAGQKNKRMKERAQWLRTELEETARDYFLCQAPEGTICAEIGVHEGDFSRKIFDTVKPAQLYLIDPWIAGEGLFGKQAVDEQAAVEARYERVRARFADETAAGRIRIERAPSSELVGQFADAHFDWIYIDGNHLCECVKQDLELYLPKVRAGGFMAGDGYGGAGYRDNGVQRAVDEFISQRPELTLEVKASQFIIHKP
jgi:hypothetical protein